MTAQPHTYTTGPVTGRADPLLEALRRVLAATAQSGSGAGEGIDSVQYRASAALYSLLVDHPVDRQGRCRSCRRPGTVLGLRRRPCRVRGQAQMWLHLPAELLHSFLVSELELTPVPPACEGGTTGAASEWGESDALPATAGDPPTGPVQPPTVPPPRPLGDSADPPLGDGGLRLPHSYTSPGRGGAAGPGSRRGRE
jgi:hypothetical protein